MKKKIILGGLLVIVLLAAGVASLPFVIDWNDYKDRFAQRIERVTGRQLVIQGDLTFSLFPRPVLTAHNVSFRNHPDGSQRNMISLKTLEMRIAFAPLFRHKVKLEKVLLKEPEILLEVLSDGTPNWAFRQGETGKKGFEDTDIGRRRELAGVQFDSVVIQDGTLVFSHAPSGVKEELPQLNAEIIGDSLKGPYRVDGRGMFQKNPLAFAVSLGKLVPEKAAELNLILSQPETQSRLKASGLLSGLSVGLSLNGNLSLDIGKTADFSRLLLDVELPPALDKPFALSSSISLSPEQAEFSDSVVKYGRTASAGNFVYREAEEDEEISGGVLEGAFMFSALNLDPWFDVLKERTAAPGKMAEQLKALLPDGMTVRFDLGADGIAWKDETLRHGEMVFSADKSGLNIPRFLLSLPGGGQLEASGEFAAEDGEFNTSLSANSEQMREIFEFLGHTPDVARGRLQGGSLSASVAGTPDAFQISDLKLAVDRTEASGSANVRFGKRPAFGALLAIDRIDADSYMPDSEEAGREGAGEAEEEDSARSPLEAFHRRGHETLEFLDETFADAGALNEFDFNVRAGLESLIWQGRVYSSIGVDASLMAGEMALNELRIDDAAGLRVSMSGGLAGFGKKAGFTDFSYDVFAPKLETVAQRFDFSLPDQARSLVNVSLKGKLNGQTDSLSLKTDNKAGPFSLTSGGVLSLDKDGALSASSEVSLRHPAARKVLRLFSDNYRPAGKTLGMLNLGGRVSSSSPRTISFEHTTLSVGMQSLQGDVSIKMDGERPLVSASLSSENLPVSPFMPEERERSYGRRQEEKSAFSLAFLKDVDVTADLKADSVTMGEHSLSDVDLGVGGKNGAYVLEKFSGRFWEGALSASGSLKAGQKSTLEGSLSLSEAKLPAPIFSSAPFYLKQGVISLNGEGKSTGQSPSDWLSEMEAKGTVSVKNAEIAGVSVGGLIRDFEERRTPAGLSSFLQSAFSPQKTTSISELSGDISVKDGAVHVSDMEIRSQGVAASADVTVDYMAEKVQGTSSLTLLPVPDVPAFKVTVKGPMKNPSRDFQSDSLETYFAELEAKDQAEARAKEKAQRQQEKAEEKRKQIVSRISQIVSKVENYKIATEEASKVARETFSDIKAMAEGVGEVDVHLSSARISADAARTASNSVSFAMNEAERLLADAREAETPESAGEILEKMKSPLEKAKSAADSTQSALQDIQKTEGQMREMVGKTVEKEVEKASQTVVTIRRLNDEIHSFVNKAAEVARQVGNRAEGIQKAEIFVSDMVFATNRIENLAEEASGILEEAKDAVAQARKETHLSRAKTALSALPSLQEKIARTRKVVEREYRFVESAGRQAMQAVQEFQEPEEEETEDAGEEEDAGMLIRRGETKKQRTRPTRTEPKAPVSREKEEDAAPSTRSDDDEDGDDDEGDGFIIRRRGGAQRY